MDAGNQRDDNLFGICLSNTVNYVPYMTCTHSRGLYGRYIMGWRNRSSTCPICRQEFLQENESETIDQTSPNASNVAIGIEHDVLVTNSPSPPTTYSMFKAVIPLLILLLVILLIVSMVYWFSKKFPSNG